MADIVYVGLIVGFFVIAIAYVRWCDRILGPDPVTDHPPAAESPTDRPAP